MAKLDHLRNSIKIRASIGKKAAVAGIVKVFEENQKLGHLFVAEVHNPARALRYFFCEENYAGHGSKLKTTLKGALNPLREYNEYRDLCKTHFANIDNKGLFTRMPRPSYIHQLKDKLKTLRIDIENNKHRHDILNRLIQYGNVLFEAIHNNANNDNENLHELLNEQFNFFKKIGQENYIRHDSSITRFFVSPFKSFKNFVNNFYDNFIKKITDIEEEEVFLKIDNEFEEHWNNLKLIIEIIKDKANFNNYFVSKTSSEFRHLDDKTLKEDIVQKIISLKKANFDKINRQGITLAEFLSKKSQENNFNLPELQYNLNAHTYDSNGKKWIFTYGADLYRKLNESLNPPILNKLNVPSNMI